MAGALVLDLAALRAWPLPALDGSGDKEVRGSVLVVAGSAEIPGAAILAANSALRAGAGKLVIATVASVASHVAVAVPESRVVALAQRDGGGLAAGCASALRDIVPQADAVLVGPGLVGGRAHAWPGAPGDRVVRRAAAPAERDSGRRGDGGQRNAHSALLVTPHAGEMAHLTGASKDEVVGCAAEMAVAAAGRWCAVVALKGATTFIASPQGRLWRHENTNPGLATSGSGDTLAGVIAGLAARGAQLEQAAAWGVVLHARAGRQLAERGSGLGLLARELPGEIPALLVQDATRGTRDE